jgi:GR25 family glycosyltransferase involved in LPS biosynthesis
VDFEFVYAIDGLSLGEDILSNRLLFEEGLTYTPGAYGCALSHLALWQETCRLDRTMTIIEDDVVFRHDFQEQVCRLMGLVPPDWDIVFWGWNLDAVLSLNIIPGVTSAIAVFDRDQLRRAMPNFRMGSEPPQLLRLDKCFGTSAYSISPSGAGKFISSCFPIRDFVLPVPEVGLAYPNFGIDVVMNTLYGTAKSYCALPPIALTDVDHLNSTIQRQID